MSYGQKNVRTYTDGLKHYVSVIVSTEVGDALRALYVSPTSDDKIIVDRWGRKNDRYTQFDNILRNFNLPMTILKPADIDFDPDKAVLFDAMKELLPGITYCDTEVPAQATYTPVKADMGPVKYLLTDVDFYVYTGYYTESPSKTSGYYPYLGTASVVTSGATMLDCSQCVIYVLNDDLTKYISFSVKVYGTTVDADVDKSWAAVKTKFWILNATPVIISDDPYQEGGGASGSGGGTGSFDGTGDAISVPAVPTLGATNTGLVTLYNPTLAQVQSLANYMWSDSFSLDSFKKLFADPMDAILGLTIVPVAVPDGSVQNIKVGNIDTGISMTLAGSQYVTVDCGSLAVNEYWGAYLDYSPYTKAEIYLPYIGMHTLSADDIMGKTVSVKYNVDILSGSCIAFVSCGDSVLYTFSGACAQNLPITGNDFAQNFAGALTLCTSTAALAAGVASGGALAAPAAGMVSSAIQATKGNVQRSGSIGGTAGMLGVQVPYLVLTRPRQCVPANQNTYQGYPAFITEDLADLSGYTEVESIQLENCTATDSEIDEIKALLAAGVLL